MQNKLGKQARSEVLEVLRERYRSASKEDKGKILDEFVAVAGCHRKHAVRLLTRAGGSEPDRPVAARRICDDAVREALVVLWEAADRICGKRLKAVLPDLVASLEQHGHLALDPMVRQRLLAASAATIDRLLSSVRGPRRAARSGRKRQSPVSRFQYAPLRTGTNRRQVIWRSTSSHMEAAPCRGLSCGASWSRMSARGGPRWCPC